MCPGLGRLNPWKLIQRQGFFAVVDLPDGFLLRM